MLSLIGRGQRVFLYCYDKKLRPPDGVELVDANEILPGDQVRQFVHRNGDTSPALHSDLFRYEVLRRFGGWYCDLDVILIGDHPPVADSYIAREDDTWVNGAVMRFPPGDALMTAAVASAKAQMESPQWGAAGPRLLTRLIDEHGLRDIVRPWSAAFPIRHSEVERLFQPRDREELEARVAGADFVHLWNEIWRWIRIPKYLGPPQGSFLDGLFCKHGIHFRREERLSAEAVSNWFREFKLVNEARQLGGELPSIKDLIRQSEQYRAERDLATQDSDERLARLSSQLAYARSERNKLLRSRSWRMTAPMRAISRYWRKLSR